MGWVGGGAFPKNTNSRDVVDGFVPFDLFYLELCIQFRDQSLGWGGVGRF